METQSREEHSECSSRPSRLGVQKAVRGIVPGGSLPESTPRISRTLKNRTTAESVEHSVNAGDRDLGYLGDVVQFMIVEYNSDAT